MYFKSNLLSLTRDDFYIHKLLFSKEKKQVIFIAWNFGYFPYFFKQSSSSQEDSYSFMSIQHS